VKIYTGCDHAGFALRNKLVDRMRNQGHEVVDFGTNSEAACDYPEYAALVASAVRGDVGSVGVLVCATGHGTAIAAGKVRGIRAFAPSSVEAARLSRFDNNTNVLCLGGRILAESDVFEIVDTWLSTGFAGGRHGRRIAKIAAMETTAALNFLVESEHLRLAAKGIPASIWAKDAAALAPPGGAREGISDNLGWLNAPSDMERELASIAAFADQVRKAGFRRAVLLGMGGSALAAEVLARVFGPAAGWLNVFVLDCTDPAAVAAVETSVDLDRTLFVVASKSGSTPEVCAFERYFWAKLLHRWAGDASQAGQHFAAITDAETELAKRASASHYRRVFNNPPDISSRFSALASFGLVPAALMGIDISRLVARAKTMAAACREATPTQNPGVTLGTLMAALAAIGRDKLTLFVSPELAPLGAWIEQLVAGATGKQGRGIIPVEGEPPGAPSGYRPDRLFVVVRLRGGAPPAPAEQLEAITTAGHPVYEIELGDKYDLGAEFFRWEFATAVAASLLEVNPFDEPETVAARQATTRLLDGYRQTGQLPSPPGVVAPADAAIVKHLAAAKPGDYLAIDAFFQPTPERDRLLGSIRTLCRDRLRLATTVGYGPRCLHVAGQLHQGGPSTGIFLQLGASVTADLPVPDEPFTFGVLRDAQGLGDLEALQARGRRVLRVDCGPDPDAGLATLLETLGALGQ
jgi:RpiB/LacA/LacB family sugar-phosphate isomerase